MMTGRVPSPLGMAESRQEALAGRTAIISMERAAPTGTWLC
ncbi:hypothetical protein [Candidatus Nitrospira bockiana]